MRKKIALSIALALLCTFITGCSKEETTAMQEQESMRQTALNENTDNKGEETDKKLILTVNDTAYAITLYDTPAANALYDMLPLDLTFEDFNNTEKIAYLQETLPTENEPDGFEPKIGDFCLYEPWGNLSVFYKDFHYSDSLISLGHFDSEVEKLANMQDDFSARLEAEK